MTETIEIIPLDSAVEEPEQSIEIKIEEAKSEIIAIEEKPKKARGRPKGKAAPKPEKLKPNKSKQVRYEEESDDELPAYAQPTPRQPVDLASQMLTLLQNHAVIKQERKRALYQSWFKRVQ